MTRERSSATQPPVAIEPLDLLIREPFGELVLTLDGCKLVVAPSKAFIHAVAGRMSQAERMIQGHALTLDKWVNRTRSAIEGRLEQLFGEFGVAECDVYLRESRLHLRIRKVRTSFGPQTFDIRQAESFVRQFERAKASQE